MRPVTLLLLGMLLSCGPLPAEPATPPPASAWAQLAGARTLDGDVVGAAPGRATVAVVFASWCGHCHDLLAELAPLAARGDVRFLGVNFRHHEEYDRRGDSAQVRRFAAAVPWVAVVPADEPLWRALGAPSLVPTMYVFDDAGALRAVYDRRERTMPRADEVAALLDGIDR